MATFAISIVQSLKLPQQGTGTTNTVINEFAQAVHKVESLAQVSAESGAEAESGMIMMLLKPFIGPIMDLFLDVIFHKPYNVCVGGTKVDDDCCYCDFKPDFTAVTTHNKPEMYNFGHDLDTDSEGSETDKLLDSLKSKIPMPG